MVKEANSNYPRIVIIGGGFGGLTLLRKLANKPFRVMLIDKNNYHTFQPLLYQVATASLTPDSIGYPIRRLVGPIDNIAFRMAEVQQILPDQKLIVTNEGSVGYDQLVIATGSKTNFFGNEAIAQTAMQLKSISQALDIRSVFLQEFEKAVQLSDARDQEGVKKALNFVIVGAGPTGVEVAGALAEIKRNILRKEYREIDPDLMEITLIDAAARVLNGMSEQSSKRAHAYLQKMEVNIITNTLVTSYNGELLVLKNGRSIETPTVIWSAGVTGNSPAGFDQAAYAKGGRIKVNAYNQVDGYEDVYAIGDVALMETTDYPEGHPMVAQPAIQQAHNLAGNFIRMTKNQAPKPFSYLDKGSMATIGRNKAVAEIGALKIGGFLAWYVWMAVHILFLIGFRNRLAVLFNWAVKYFSYRNTIRLIVRPFNRKAAV
jgi:NADH dehydrogenase